VPRVPVRVDPRRSNLLVNVNRHLIQAFAPGDGVPRPTAGRACGRPRFLVPGMRLHARWPAIGCPRTPVARVLDVPL